MPSYMVNCQEVSDLRRCFRRHAKSDRIDARVLAKLPSVNPEHLHPLTLSSAKLLACQRGCKELDRLSRSMVALQNRLRAMDRFAWPGLTPLVFKDLYSPTARWFREHWYDPNQVLTAGASVICRLEALGYDMLPTPQAIVDSYIPLTECTAFSLKPELLRNSRVPWIDRQRVALIRLQQRISRGC